MGLTMGSTYSSTRGSVLIDLLSTRQEGVFFFFFLVLCTWIHLKATFGEHCKVVSAVHSPNNRKFLSSVLVQPVMSVDKVSSEWRLFYIESLTDDFYRVWYQLFRGVYMYVCVYVYATNFYINEISNCYNWICT